MAERAGLTLAMLVLTTVLAAVEVPLSAPLTTIVPCTEEISGPRRIRATITVPAGAATDLGVGAVIRDRDGRWFQVLRRQPLRVGTNTVDLTVDTRTPAQAHPQAGDLDLPALTTCTRSALILWSSATGGSVDVDGLSVERLPEPTADFRLRDLDLAGYSAETGTCTSPCGARWSASVVPEPFPANPFDPAEFRLDAVVSGPDGERRLAAFFTEDVELSDRGDTEAATIGGRPRFDLRFRPKEPERYRIRLEATWGDGTTRTWQVPDLVATGARVDEVVRIDVNDPRFFAVDGAFHWPLGINLHSTYDKRGAEVCGTRLTPARGSLVYEAIIPRIAAAGIDTCEIWMSSWNLGLEWRADWPGFAGPGRYHLGNAERLDRVLDLAWAHGIRVNLVINNHGQASANADREWKDNPYFRANGGPIDTPEEIFAHPEALALQQRLRRYLCARYADHPAILGWKLWSEVDLTAGKGDPLIRWHEQAAAAWAEADTYGHPCTTHWCGDYKHVNPGVAALPGIAYVCMDAYRGGRQVGDRWSSLPDLLANSMHDPARGLLRWNKPILATEYGAWNHAAEAMRSSDLRVAPFAALVSGHGGAPMTWWWEWVDQGERWAPFRAFRAFLDGEDLRGDDARSVALHAQAGEPGDSLWCRAWIRPGRILGHVVDTTFATRGTERRLEGARITIGTQVEAGRMRLVCYDADTGRIVRDQDLDHPGGTLVLTLPPFQGHAAFKCWRIEDTAARPAAGETPQAGAGPGRS